MNILLVPDGLVRASCPQELTEEADIIVTLSGRIVKDGPGTTWVRVLSSDDETPRPTTVFRPNVAFDQVGIRAILEQAIATENEVDISYTSKGGVTSFRTIRPVAIDSRFKRLRSDQKAVLAHEGDEGVKAFLLTGIERVERL